MLQSAPGVQIITTIYFQSLIFYGTSCTEMLLITMITNLVVLHFRFLWRYLIKPIGVKAVLAIMRLLGLCTNHKLVLLEKILITFKFWAILTRYNYSYLLLPRVSSSTFSFGYEEKVLRQREAQNQPCV